MARPDRRVGLFRRTCLRLGSGWALGAYAWGLFTATHWPAHFRTDTVILGWSLDRWVHGMLYAPLAILLAGYLSQRRIDSRWFRWRRWLMPLMLLIAAAADEYTQGWVGRSPSVPDFIGDALGILLVTLGWCLLSLAGRLRHNQSHSARR